MLKQILTIILLTAFVAQTFHQVLLVGNYYLNTKSFAVNCENKNRPQLHCNGHCQLMKKMKSEENKDKQNPERKENKNEVVYFYQTQSHKDFSVTGLKQNFIHQNNSSTKDFSISFFHPPQAQIFVISSEPMTNEKPAEHLYKAQEISHFVRNDGKISIIKKSFTQ